MSVCISGKLVVKIDDQLKSIAISEDQSEESEESCVESDGRYIIKIVHVNEFCV